MNTLEGPPDMQDRHEQRGRHDKTVLRFGSRVGLGVPVRLSADGVPPCNGTLRNASVSGAFVETALELPLHTNLIVLVDIAGQSGGASHCLNACVARLDASGLGIEWRDMGSVDVVDLLHRATPA